jgi:hypothetical protein
MAAIAAYEKRNQPKVSTGRKNAKPEKELERQVMAWLNANGFLCNVVEAKATYNPKVGRYISQSVVSGFSDIVGVAPGGYAVFVELKAPGRLGTLKPHQRAFLEARALMGAFALAVDSVELLATSWKRYQDRHTACRSATAS